MVYAPAAGGQRTAACTGREMFATRHRNTEPASTPMPKTPLSNTMQPQHWLLLVLIPLALSGCAGVGALMGPSPATLADQAHNRFAQQHYAQASVLYQRAAQNAAEPQRSRYYLGAARAALHAGDNKLTLQLLGRVNARVLGAEGRARTSLTQLRAHIADLTAAEALTKVARPGPAATPQLAAGIWQLRAELLFRMGRLLDGVHALVQRRIWLLKPSAIARNSEQIWQALQNAKPAQYQPAPGVRPGRITQGWIKLASISQRYEHQPEQLKRALSIWAQHYPNHPATRTILPNQLGYTATTARTGGDFLHAGTIGLALPLSGDLSTPANAILDGFLAAYYQQPTPRPVLKIYDTHAIPEGQSLMALAASGGISILVGPLTKSAVRQIASRHNLSIPVLALNYTDGAGRLPALYQFGLSPEDEARAVARRAISMGWEAGLALIPRGRWGTRILTAFQSTLTQSGGTLLQYDYYDPTREDHAESIKAVLNYGADHGAPKDTDPLAEHADFIFLAAQPTQARLLRTQLRFFGATSIPVLATSHLYSKASNGQRHGDLVGVMFADMPWVLGTHNADARKQRLASHWATATGNHARLFAMGLDAWALAQKIRQHALYPRAQFQGATGKLHLQPDGQIRRQLDWAQFVHGKPKILPPRDVVVLPGRDSLNTNQGTPAENDRAQTNSNTWNPPGPIGTMPKPVH